MCEKCEKAAGSKAPRWRGRYDRAALRRACKELGVSKPVRIICDDKSGVRPDRPLPREGISFGYQTMPLDESEHIVHVTRHLPLDVANHTLCHELAHCAQCERNTGDMARARAMDKLNELIYGYADSPHEVEAEAVAERIDREYQIARA